MEKVNGFCSLYQSKSLLALHRSGMTFNTLGYSIDLMQMHDVIEDRDKTINQLQRQLDAFNKMNRTDENANIIGKAYCKNGFRRRSAKVASWINGAKWMHWWMRLSGKMNKICPIESESSMKFMPSDNLPNNVMATPLIVDEQIEFNNFCNEKRVENLDVHPINNSGHSLKRSGTAHQRFTYEQLVGDAEIDLDDSLDISSVIFEKIENYMNDDDLLEYLSICREFLFDLHPKDLHDRKTRVLLNPEQLRMRFSRQNFNCKL